MNTDKKNARMVGILYIAATVAGVLSLAFTDPVLGSEVYLTKISSNENQVLFGLLMILVMAVSVVGIAVAAYPVLKKHNQSIAIGYIGARLIESILYMIGVISVLSLIPLSQEFEKAGTSDVAYFQTIADLLLDVQDWGAHIVLDVAVFPIGAIIFYALLYQAELTPRWLSGWGIIAALLYLGAGLMVMFSVIEPLSTVQIILNIPLALQELVLALWLIVKGFNPSALRSEPA